MKTAQRHPSIRHDRPPVATGAILLVALVSANPSSGTAWAAAGDPLSSRLNVSAGATARPVRFEDPIADVKTVQPPNCAPGTDCAVALTTELRHPTTDQRRIAVFVDLPAGSGQVIGADGGWRCQAGVEGPSVCTVRIDQIQGKQAFSVTARLASALQDSRMCIRPPRLSSAGAIVGDPESVRLIQALLAEDGRNAGPLDGRWKPALRAELLAALKDDQLAATSDEVLAATYLGERIIRAPMTTPPCMALAAVAPGDASATSSAPPPGVLPTPKADPKPAAKKPAPAGTSASRPKPPPGYVYSDDPSYNGPPPGTYPAQPQQQQRLLPRLFPRLRVFGTP